jgi:tetratricopeptide (TPR) repeat protein
MKKDILFKKLREGIEKQDYLILQQFCEIAEAEYPNENETLQAQITFAKINWNNPKVLEYTILLAAQNPDNIAYQFDQALAYLQNQQQTQGIVCLDMILNKYPKDEQVLAQYAKIVIANISENNMIEKAIQILSELIKKYPNAPQMLLDRALAYQNLANYPLAEIDLKRAQSLEPNNIDIVQQLITLCNYTAKTDNIDGYYQQIINNSAYNEDILTAYGDFLMSQSNYPKAIEQYTKIISKEAEKEYGKSQNRKNRAEAYLQNQQYQLALLDFNAALSEFEDGATKLGRAKAYQGLKDEKSFLADIKSVLKEKDFYYADALLLRADYYLTQQKFDKAKADFNAILNDAEMSFHNKDAYFGLGKLYQQRNDLKKAAEFWQKAAAEYHPKANEMINLYCKIEIANADNKRRAELSKQYAAEKAKNKQSPILSQLFNKCWVLDTEATLTKNQSVAELPEALMGFFIEAFRLVNVLITDTLITLDNPNAETIEAFYKITEENNQSVQIYGQPTNSKESRTLILSLIDNNLKISGLMSQAAADMLIIDLYFKIGEKPTNSLNEEEQADRMKNLAENFLTGILQTVVDGIENANSADGEPASDNKPTDLQHD